MGNSILAGVGTIELRNGSTGQIIAHSTTLTDSGITIDVSSEDIRGGQSAKLIGKYFHSSNFNLNLTDATFNLEYIALNVGGNITVGGDALETETVTSGAGSITVTGTPIAWNGMTDIVGWYYDPSVEKEWHKITFTGKTATVTGLVAGKTLCVKYNSQDSSLRELIVPTSIIPSECFATLTIPMFAADQTNFTSSSKIGELVVEIPRYQLSGSQDLSLTMTGASTTSLSGSALVSYAGNTSCDEGGYYAKIKEIIAGRTMESGLVDMLVSGGNFSIAKNGTKTLKVVGLYEDGATGVLDNSRLTFTTTGSIGSVSSSGVLTAGSTAGTGTINIVATNKTSVTATVGVTVTA